jgi:hypothetical protein
MLKNLRARKEGTLDNSRVQEKCWAWRGTVGVERVIYIWETFRSQK